MTMHNPAHPGQLIYIQLIEDEDGKQLNSVANAAASLGVHRNTLNRVLNGSASVTAALALALQDNGHSSAEFWLKAQMAYDLFNLRQSRAASKGDRSDKRGSQTLERA